MIKFMRERENLKNLVKLYQSLIHLTNSNFSKWTNPVLVVLLITKFLYNKVKMLNKVKTEE